MTDAVGGENAGGLGWVVVQLGLIAAILGVGFFGSGDWGWAALGVGVGLWIYAAWVGLAGVRDLGRSLTPMPRPRAGGVLVTGGIYARLRHPLYSAVMAMGFGWGLFWSSGAAVVLAGVLAGFLNEKARHEEWMLRERYPGYADYAARVPRFVPGWSSRQRGESESGK